MATMQNLLTRFLRNKPRTKTVTTKTSPLGQMMEQFELEMRWVPATFNPAPGVGTISAAIAIASPGDTIQLSAGDYSDWVVIPANLDGLKILGVPGTTLRPLNNDPFELNGNGSGHLISVLADDVQISNISFNGAGTGNASVLPGNLSLGGTPIWASKAITNYQGLTDINSIGNITITNNVFTNFGGHAIAFDMTLTGGTIANNTISNYGIENGQSPFTGATNADLRYQPWAGVSLLNNSYANVTNNTITVPANNYGVRFDNLLMTGASATIANNTVSVGQGGIGITLNFLYGTSSGITVANNTVDVPNSVTTSSLMNTRGINVYSVFNSVPVFLNNNTIGGGVSNGTFDRGIDLWNVGTLVDVNGGSIAKAAVGLNVDGIDPYFGNGTAGATVVDVANLTVNVSGATFIGVQATNLAGTTPQIAPALPNPGRQNVVTSNVTINLTGGSVNNAVANAQDVRACGTDATFRATINLLGSITGASKQSQVGANGFIVDARALRQWDFGTTAQGAAGYTPFVPGSPTTTVNSTTGVGFVGNNPIFFSQAVGTLLTKDIVRGGSTAPATFHVPAAAGTYTLTFNVGWTIGGQPATTTVGVTGSSLASPVASVTRSTVGNGVIAGPAANNTITITGVTLLSDGFLNFNFSTTASNWVVSGLTVNRIS